MPATLNPAICSENAGQTLTLAPALFIKKGQRDPLAINYDSRYYYGFFGQAAKILGTADLRYGFGIGLGYGRAEPRFSLREIKAQLVYEGYYDQTASYSFAHSNTYAVGVLGLGRWFWPQDSQGRAMFADLGIGLQYANTQTFDLDTRLNTTPTAGFGGVFPVGTRQFTLELRLLHISNGGTDRPNRGQNEFLIMMGVRV